MFLKDIANNPSVRRVENFILTGRYVMAWVLFCTSAMVIIWAGIDLTRYADRLSDRLNLGKAWVGTLLLGFVTSLPEAITCIKAVISLGAYDLAMGNLVGSNNFNPLLIVVMDICYRKGSVSDRIHPHRSHQESVFYLLLLTAVLAFDVYTQGFWHYGPMSVSTFVIGVGYFLVMRRLATLNKQNEGTQSADDVMKGDRNSLAKIWTHIVISGCLIVLAAMVLASSSNAIAISTGWGGTFVGSILVACVTSLPEMVVTISSMRLAAFDLAVGNILGSNISNLFILVFCSLFSAPQTMLSQISSVHLLTVGSSMALVILLWLGIRQKRKWLFLSIGWDSWMMMMIFLTSSYLLFKWS